MSKRVQITPELEKTIRAAIGDPEFNTSNVTVFEARFLSTEPLKKRGFFNKARVTASTLSEMAQFMAAPGNAIPLHIMHEDNLLPVGRVFSARTMTLPNGETELRGQFYLPNDRTQFISDIEASVIDEVSVGLATKHAFCSECGFDYHGPDADLMNFLTGTCAEGHEIGVDGVHARLSGLDAWLEQSLVGRGAANDAKIMPRAKQSMSREMADHLAANKNSEAKVLTASCKLSTEPEGDDMSTTEIMAKYEAKVEEAAGLKTDLKAATDKATALEAKVKELEASATAKDDEIKALKEGTASGVAEVTARAEKAEASLAAATEVVAPHVKAALVASNVPETDVPADLVAQLKMVEDKGLKLHQIVGVGPQSSGKPNDLKATVDAADEDRKKQAFKTKR